MNADSHVDKIVQTKYENSKNFILDLKGFEGPLHLLLNLSRSQKVDLRQISLVDLCDQYLDFVSEAKKLKIEIAADYLIMASWLVLLKSELLLPKDKIGEGNDSDALAQNLQFQLLRLDAIRHVASKLMSSDQLDRDFFKRGDTEKIIETKETVHKASLLDLLQAYAGLKTKDNFQPLHLLRSIFLTPEEALDILNKKLSGAIDWQKLEQFIPQRWRQDKQRIRTAVATNFAVCLEQARLKKFEIKQLGAFGPLYLRKADQFKNGE